MAFWALLEIRRIFWYTTSMAPKPPTPASTRRRFDENRRQAYIDALRTDGEANFARIEVGVSDETVAAHRKKDAEFDAACEDALHTYRKRFIDELVRRGVDGVEKPVFHNGEVVGHVTEYSDRLLLEHLKVVDRRYREKLQLEVQTHIQTSNLQLDKLQPESRLLVQQILEIEAAAEAREVIAEES